MNLPAELDSETTNERWTPDPLPPAWVERLFSKLLSEYGSRFSDMWAGVPADEVKAQWGRRLAGYEPQEIKRGLDSLEPTAPTLPKFLLLCRPDGKRPRKPEPEALMPPMVSAEKVAELRQGIAEIENNRPGLDWARRIVNGERPNAGAHAHSLARAALREVGERA
jgi:hypothetical protein